jgi:putative endonuclease
MLADTGLAVLCTNGSVLAASRNVSAAKRFVYVLKSGAPEVSAGDAARYYVGLTSDMSRRLVAHNEGRTPHTSRYGPWRTHVVIEFADEATAIRFERYLKSGSGRAFAKRHFG